MAKILQLNNGCNIPVIGLGTYDIPGQKVEQAIFEAIDVGYRHFDCAWLYGNEKEIGNALSKVFQSGKVKREDLFITSKLWNNFHAKKSVIPMIKESLKNLKLDYLDLYLIHWPMGFKEESSIWPSTEGKSAFSDIDYLETWEGMEECANSALTKSIGVSNFNEEQLTRVLNNSKIKPVVNQIEVNPSINQKHLIQFCKDRDVVITGYTPMGRAASSSSIFDKKVTAIGKKYNKSGSQVVLNYLVSLGITVVPKATTKAHIQDNIDIFGFSLNAEEVAYMDTLNTNQRVCHYPYFATHKYYPFK